MSSSGRSEEVDQTLFVGNLESRVREEILYELFLQAGPLIKVTICKDKEGKPKSFGFVCFKHKESVPYAVALLNGIRLYGRPIRVQFRFGSSHSAEQNNPKGGFENYTDLHSPSYRYQEPYGNLPVPVTPFPMNNSPPYEYLGFPKMVNSLGQQYPVQSPMVQQFPYYQMTPPQPSNFCFSPYQNQAANFKSAQSSFEMALPHSSHCGMHQVDKRTYKRKREHQSYDSDTSAEGDNMRQRKDGKKYRKCKAKRKRR
ncbi:splicing regulator RBM11 [Melopsittacus undulatus]|uniref:splicing regulator RBM11 n=1 Tax=Melopsittacus undulatus TaxID=13146 RepID=UPI00146A0FDB|nr:splicing regulator RBM11 [Melopsittacus undulatus]